MIRTHAGERSGLLCGLLLFSCCLSPANAAARAGAVPAQLPRQGTVVFLGDSITWQNHFLVFIEAHLRGRHPDWSLRLLNRGVRGDTVSHALARLERDVIAHAPALVVIQLGMNDGGYRGVDRPRLARYREELTSLVKKLRARSKAALVLCTPTAVDPPQHGYNTMLAALAAVVSEVAAAQGTGLVDLFTPFRQLLAEARQRKPAVALMEDAIHPAPGGHLLLASLLLAKLHPCSALPPHRLTLAFGQPASLTVRAPAVFVPPAARPALQLLSRSRQAELLGSPRVVAQGAKDGLSPELRCGPDQSGAVRALGQLSAEQLAGERSLAFPAAPWEADAARMHHLLAQRWRWQHALWDPQARGVQRLAEGRSVLEVKAALARVEAALAHERPRQHRCQLLLVPAAGDRSLHPEE